MMNDEGDDLLSRLVDGARLVNLYLLTLHSIFHFKSHVWFQGVKIVIKTFQTISPMLVMHRFATLQRKTGRLGFLSLFITRDLKKEYFQM